MIPFLSKAEAEKPPLASGAAATLAFKKSSAEKELTSRMLCAFAKK